MEHRKSVAHMGSIANIAPTAWLKILARRCVIDRHAGASRGSFVSGSLRLPGTQDLVHASCKGALKSSFIRVTGLVLRGIQMTRGPPKLVTSPKPLPIPLAMSAAPNGPTPSPLPICSSFLKHRRPEDKKDVEEE